MNNGSITALQIGISTGGSVVVSTAVSADPLLTALITLGVSLITILSTEGVKLLASWLKAKREEIEKKHSESDKKED